jgi:ABC-type phosphate transport system auxiliary subunit
MSNVYDLDYYRKKKEEEALERDAAELKQLLESLMLEDEPLIITIVDDNGNSHNVDLNDIIDPTD